MRFMSEQRRRVPASHCLDLHLDTVSLRPFYEGSLGIIARKHALAGAKGVLQLGATIMLCRSASLHGFERGRVQADVYAALSQLRAFGIDQSLLDVSKSEVDAFAGICARAGDLTAQNVFPWNVSGARDVMLGRPPMDPAQIKWERRFWRWALRRFVSLIPESEFRAKAETAGIYAAPILMVLMSSKLRARLVELGAMYWTAAQAADFILLSRICLNQQIATDTGRQYLPALSRARILWEAGVNVLQACDSGLRRTAAGCERLISVLELDDTAAPGCAAFLLAQSKGTVQGVIECAIKAREIAQPLRDSLANMKSRHGNSKREAADCCAELAAKLYGNCGSMSAFLPQCIVSIGLDLVPRVELHWSVTSLFGRAKGVVLVSELARGWQQSVAHDEHLLTKLAADCCRNAAA